MTINGDQLRMARAVLKLGGRELAEMTGVDKMTIVRIEAGSKAYTSTLERLREALEEAGVFFTDAQEGVHGPGVALRSGVKPETVGITRREEGSTDTGDDGLSSRAWDEDFEEIDSGGDRAQWSDEDRASMRRYYDEHPDRWEKLSPLGKAYLAKAMRLNDSETRA